MTSIADWGLAIADGRTGTREMSREAKTDACKQ
jgi:hypothetical protein